MDDPNQHQGTGSARPADWLLRLAWQLQTKPPPDPAAKTDVGRRADSSEAFRRGLPTLPMSAGLSSGEVFQEPFEPDPEGGLGRLGDFRLLREVGHGGMGVVFEAVQVSLNRRVALKVLPFAAALDARQLARFQLEAQAAASLRHNHIVPVFATGAERGVPYYAMQFIEGRDLARVIRGGDSDCDPLDEPERIRAAAGLGQQAADALEYAHRNEVLHRDIKPSNLLLDAEGKLWITDFGLARVRGDSNLTPTGEAPGTPRYMSPEQALGRRARTDGRSDIYALGATLYEFLTGAPAFAGDDRLELLRRIAREEPIPIRQLNPAVPVDLETVIQKAMAKDPDDRYPTARDLARDLGRFLLDQPVLARRSTALGAALRWSRRHQGLVATTAAAAVLLAAGLAVASWWSNAWLRRHNARLEHEIARADAHAREAETQRRIAVDRQRLADRHLYAANLRLAGQALDAGRFERAQTFLRDAAAVRGDEPRGFAWDYLWGAARREVVALRGPESKARALAVTPDGLSLALAEVGGALRLWNLAVERPAPRLNAPGEVAAAPTFSPDGRLLAALVGVGDGGVGRAGTARGVAVWDAAVGRRLFRRESEQGASALRCAFLGGGRVLGVKSVLLDGSRALQLWSLEPDPARPRLVAVFNGLLGAAMTADGRAVLTIEESRLTARDARTGLPLTTVSGDFAGAGPWAIAPDGRAFAGVVPGRGVVRWSAETGAEIGREEIAGPVAALHFAPTGSILAVVDLAGLVHLRGPEPGGGRCLRPDDLDRRRSVLVAFAPDGTTLATSPGGIPGGQQPVALWEVATGRKLATFPGRGDPVDDLAFAPDGRSLFLAGGAAVRCWRFGRVASRGFPASVSHGVEAWSLAVSPDGRHLASGSDHAEGADAIKVWDTFDARQVASWRGHDAAVAALAFSPDGQVLASAALRGSGNLRLWRASTGRLLANLVGHADRVRSVAFSPDGSTLVSAGDDGSVRVWDLSAQRPRFVLTGHADVVRQVAFSPDGSTLVSAGDDGSIRLWDVASGAPRRSLRVGEPIAGVAFSPTGSIVAAADQSGQLTLWSLDSDQPLSIIRAEGEGLRCLAFAPDGQTLAASGESRIIRLFDISTGLEVLTLKGHDRMVNALVFTPDGRLLSSCGHDGAVRFWPIESP